jgi:hypothetical protein
MNARREAGLVEEHLHEFGLALDMGVHHLQRHEALKATGAVNAGEMNRGHPTRGDHAERLISPATKDHSYWFCTNRAI